MAAVASDRQTILLAGVLHSGEVVAGRLIHDGGIGMRNAAGNVVKGVVFEGFKPVYDDAMHVVNTENAAGGGTNPWKGTAELIVTPFLTA